jgi:outer membrane biosynthesis protein TonB
MVLSGAAEVHDEPVGVASPLPSTRGEGAAALAAPSVASGEFDSRIVASRIRGTSSRIKRCYERELAQNPTLRGGLRIEFTIMSDGSVAHTQATENTISPTVGACVVEVIASLRFTPGPTGGSVRYRFPFLFEPGG